jgi:hypothetical protein
VRCSQDAERPRPSLALRATPGGLASSRGYPADRGNRGDSLLSLAVSDQPLLAGAVRTDPARSASQAENGLGSRRLN